MQKRQQATLHHPDTGHTLKRIRLLSSVFLLVTSDLNTHFSKFLIEWNIWFMLHKRQENPSSDYIINVPASDGITLFTRGPTLAL